MNVDRRGWRIAGRIAELVVTAVGWFVVVLGASWVGSYAALTTFLKVQGMVQ